MKLTFKRAKLLCGLDESFEITSEETYLFAKAVWKEKTVDARRTCNDALASELSQCKELFKRRHLNRVVRVCPTCGGSKSAHAMRCFKCSITDRFYHNAINAMATFKEHEIETGTIYIPARKTTTGVLTHILEKLSQSPVGDSFVTNRQPSSVKLMAKMIGLEVLLRIANPEEKNVKQRRWRVWRTDGLDMDGVNEVIRKRMAGEPVPPPRKCVPLAGEALAKMRGQKHPPTNGASEDSPEEATSRGRGTSGSRLSSSGQQARPK